MFWAVKSPPDTPDEWTSKTSSIPIHNFVWIYYKDWRHCSLGSAYPLLSVSVESASLSEP